MTITAVIQRLVKEQQQPLFNHPVDAAGYKLYGLHGLYLVSKNQTKQDPV